MKVVVTAAAVTAALALTPLPTIAQDSTTQAQTSETQTPEAQTSTEAQTSPEAEAFSVVTTPEDLEGMDTAEVRIEPIEEAPRDQVPAINNSLDPSNPEAVELRQQISEMETVQEALDEEGIEEERVVGAAMDNGELVLYILPEG